MRYYIGDYGSSRGLRGMMYSVLCLPSRRFEETYHCVKFLRFSLQNSKQVQDDRPIVHGGLLVVQPSSTSCRGLNYNGGRLWQHVKLKLKVWVGIAVEHCLGALNAESLDALIKTAPITRVLLVIVNVAIVEVN